MTHDDENPIKPVTKDSEPTKFEGLPMEVKQLVGRAIEQIYDAIRTQGMSAHVAVVLYDSNPNYEKNGGAAIYTTPGCSLRIVHDIICPRVASDPDSRLIPDDGSEFSGKLN